MLFVGCKLPLLCGFDLCLVSVKEKKKEKNKNNCGICTRHSPTSPTILSLLFSDVLINMLSFVDVCMTVTTYRVCAHCLIGQFWPAAQVARH